MTKSGKKDILIVSFALFSMFFGAGNVIFPPFLGSISGNSFWTSGLGFIMTGAGLPILGIIAIAKSNTFDAFGNRVFSKFPLLLGSCIMIAIGPLLAIPKTAALTYEIGIKALFSTANDHISIAMFFIITLFFSLNSSNVIDKLGAILTPVLLISLIILIIQGIIQPIGVPAKLDLPQSFSRGFVEGYQTMDALASIMFAGVIIKTMTQRGYEGENLKKISSLTGFIAGLGLALIYLGLIYIGACMSSTINADISKSELVILMAEKTLGNLGKLILSSIIGLACLTTSIGLTTTAGEYFETATNGKLKYKSIVIFTCIFSFFIASMKVEKIVEFSAPILSALYPTSIILIIFNVLCLKNDYIYKGACIPVLLYSIPNSFLSAETAKEIDKIYPLFTNAFGWLPLAIIGGFIGYIMSIRPNKNKTI